MREINQKGLEIIKRFEGLEDGDVNTANLDPYMDPVGIWTIGWGHAIAYDGAFLRGDHDKKLAYRLYKNGITIEQAETLLRADVLNTCRDVENALLIDITDNQFSALVSFTFNVGIFALKKSTLLLKLNNFAIKEVPEQMMRWIYGTVGGKRIVLKGLERRRQAEAELWKEFDKIREE